MTKKETPDKSERYQTFQLFSWAFIKLYRIAEKIRFHQVHRERKSSLDETSSRVITSMRGNVRQFMRE